VVAEAPAVGVLSHGEEQQASRTFAQMTQAYFASFANGDTKAIAAMIDFYGGAGTFASWPPRVRSYAAETTAVNILDWATAYGFALPAAALAAIEIPTLVIVGGSSHPAIRRANALVRERISGAAFASVDGAAHFMITTHAQPVAELIAQHVCRAEAAPGPAVAAARPPRAASGRRSSS
jgi:pimeloyl-ACP methyl ester carboxylesterase